ncbi:hypothetical protein GTP56_18400 [Duganella sp. FT134W]|uniref:O-antigen ligase-related domain-containing protein n=1 Tax=Duganella margarita TaxID=2692170 RepID=A0A7X4H2K8_9BURK|nr:O-antigen ligase family protein [Duganella margarita]MYM74158.1 hypothetical protein [Duganella margarita]
MKIQNSMPGSARKRPASIGGWDKAMLVMLVMCLVQFFGVWFYPKFEFGSAVLANQGKALSVPFQYLLWAFVLLSAARFLQQRGAAPLVDALKPFFPFLLVGLAASAFGIDPFGSLRMMSLWGLMALSAVVLGYSIPPERALRTMLGSMFVFLLLSAIWSVAMPAYGLQGGEGANMWRGLFVGKNLLGWIAALVLVVACSMYRTGYRRLPAMTIVLAVLCLMGSGSKGALVAALAALAYGYLVPRLMRHVTPGFGTAIILVGGLCAVVCAALVFPIIVDLLGRDVTLTGRTIIWKTYFMSMTNTPWLGQGPGAYTALSAITAVLAARLNDLGAIATPHNIYLGVLGDAGLFGLLAFLGMMIYMVLIVPAYRRGYLWMLTGTIGFLIMANGLVETQQIFSAGPGWFLLILLRSMALRQSGTVGAEPAQQARVRPMSKSGLAPAPAPALHKAGF